MDEQVTHHVGGAADSRQHGRTGGPDEEDAEHEPFKATLETYIEQLEGFAAQADTSQWEEAVIRLQDAAREVRADRITATASLLLGADIADRCVVPELLDRLRSDGRIFALEEECRRKEEALAAELAALDSSSEQRRT